MKITGKKVKALAKKCGLGIDVLEHHSPKVYRILRQQRWRNPGDTVFEGTCREAYAFLRGFRLGDVEFF